MNGYPVKFASCEDVIIHKMFAGRSIDEEDIKNILIKNRDKIDIKYIKKWLSEFDKIPEQKGILIRFNKLLKRVLKNYSLKRTFFRETALRQI
jgi:predicted nucleotidyltransferase